MVESPEIHTHTADKISSSCRRRLTCFPDVWEPATLTHRRCWIPCKLLPQCAAGKGLSVSKSHKQTELLLRQLGWMAASLNLLPGSERRWRPVSTFFLGQRGELHTVVWMCGPLHRNKTCSLGTGSGFTFVSE